MRKSTKNRDIIKYIVNNPKDTRISISIVLCTIFAYYVLGYILKTDILNAVTIRKNGVSFSFIGIFLLIITSSIIGYIFNIIKSNKTN